MKINHIIRVILIVTAFNIGGSARASCDADSCLLDFWIGSWQLSRDDGDGTTGTGSNEIHKILDGKVIAENFAGLTGKNADFIGKSWNIQWRINYRRK